MLLSLLLPASRPLSAAEAPSMRIVYNALGGSMAPLWVGQEFGLFAKHGLQHSLNYLAATTSVQAIVAGSEDIGMVGNQCIDVALEGADTIYVAGNINRFVFHLYGDPAIKTVQDLKGKTVAVAAEGAACGVLPICAGHSGLAEVTSILGEKLPPQVRQLLSFERGMHAVDDLASKMTGWLDLDERLRVSGRVGLASTAADRFGWEAVAENVVNAARGRTAVLEPVPGEVPFSGRPAP